MRCDDKTVLLDGKCVALCPLGKRNIHNECIKCREEDCKDLKQEYFEFEKID